MPRCFVETYGEKMKKVIGVEIGGAKYTRFKFCCETHTISGLRRFLRLYDIRCNYTRCFALIGDLEFALYVYNAHGTDHLRDMGGSSRLHYLLSQEKEPTTLIHLL